MSPAAEAMQPSEVGLCTWGDTGWWKTLDVRATELAEYKQRIVENMQRPGLRWRWFGAGKQWG